MMSEGVDLGKIDKAHLARVAAQLGAKVPLGASAERLVEEVTKIFKRPGMTLAGPCDNCGGMSDSLLSECPFCGIGDEDEDESKTAPIAKVDAPVAMVVSGEKELDRVLAEIEGHKAGATMNLWKLGQKVKEIYDKQLWLRRTEAGKPAYKGFDAFVHHEIKGMSKTTAYWLMDIAEAFNEKEVLAYGRTKLAYVLKAPKEDRALLLDKVKEGIGSRALSEEVDKARTARGEFVRETTRSTDVLGRDQSLQRAGVGKKAQKGKKKRGDSITVAKTFGRQQVKMWLRPDKTGATPTKRARKLGDKPYGVLELDNGVRMLISWTTSSAGDFITVVETKRPEA